MNKFNKTKICEVNNGGKHHGLPFVSHLFGKHKSLKISQFKYLKYLPSVSVSLLVLFAAFTVFPVAEVKENVTAEIKPEQYALTVDVDELLELTLAPTSSGKLAIKKNTVTVTAPSPSGYQLYVSSANNDPNMSLNGDTSGSADKTIYNNDGDFTAPTALTLENNKYGKWGFAVPSTGSKFADLAAYTATEPDDTATFAGMPTVGNEVRIKDVTGSVENDTTDIYYGVKANYGVAQGDYSTTISYYTLTQLSDVKGGEIEITPNELTEGYAATPIEIKTSLNTSLDLSTNTNLSVTIGGTTCANPTVSQATKLAVITCAVPAGLAIGSYDVDVTITKGIYNFHYSKAGGVTVKSAGITLTFDANGGTFPGGSTTNVLTYSNPQVVHGTYTKTVTSKKNGERKANKDETGYDNNLNYYDDVTITNATSLTVDITYATENATKYDIVCIFEGTSFTPTALDDCNSSKSGKLGGTTKTSKTFTINGDTARIYFKTDGSGNTYYGYWADITGEGDEITQNLLSGTYIDKPADRPGYVFLGWATTPNATTPDYTYDASAIVNENTTVYAVWIKVDGTMQDFACSTLASGGVKLLSDSRDGNIYFVSKLADGKCWMLDNLALDLTNQTVLNGLDATNTNIDTTNDPDALAALKGTSVRDPGTDSTGKYATAKVANWTSSYNYSAPLVNATDKDKVFGAMAGSIGFSKVGVYYNYCAASAGSYCYGNGTSAGTSSGNATSSICPAGWRMPTGGSSGEYQALYTAYSSNYTNFRNALTLPLSGYFGNGSAYYQGSDGYFWSSTRYDNYYMYNLYVYTSNINPAGSGSRGSGLSVRCVAGS